MRRAQTAAVRRYALSALLRVRPPAPELRPDRLYAFLDALYERRNVPGAVLEVGCFRGGTARMAHGFLQQIGSSKRYVAVDTFAGFVAGQFAHDQRAGTARRLEQGFGVNDIRAVRRFLDAHGGAGVELVQGDVAALPDSALPDSIAVCLMDVDLELPTYEGLARVAPRLTPGGIILVDDCDPASDYPGALNAYRRYVGERTRPEEFVMEMGVVRAAEESAHQVARPTGHETPVPPRPQ